MAQAMLLPARRSDLVLKPVDDQGRHVVKDPRAGAYFHIEAQEAFLLAQLDGKRTFEQIRADFERQFEEPLPREDFDEFVALAQRRGFLADAAATATDNDDDDDDDAPAKVGGSQRPFRLLAWRVSFFDPDRLFTRLAPVVAFFWTRAFLFLSLLVAGVAALTMMVNRHEFLAYFPHTLRWDSLVAAYATIFLATCCHEFAHGLTCKRYGGEVREVGFLFMYFLPCLYCNVSDAWLFREKSKRMLVTLAGPYCDLCMWAVAVFVWHVTLPGTLPYHLAWLAVSVCGVRCLLNFFPLIKLDGYYLLSDWLDMPNLRQRSLDRWTGYLRWAMWGADRPAPEPRGRFLFLFGMISWLFTLSYVFLILFGIAHVSVTLVGLIGLIPFVVVARHRLPSIFRGLTQNEVSAMLHRRYKRIAFWLVLGGAVAAALIWIPAPNRASGTFVVRPVNRAEVRAPVAGFLQVVYAEDGQRVEAGGTVVCLEIPDLASRKAQKAAEVAEVEAKVQLLELGARPEEIAERRLKVRRSGEWRELAQQHLGRAQKALTEEMDKLDKQISQAKTQLEFATDALERGRRLLESRSIARDVYNDLEKQVYLCRDQLAVASAAKRERETIGVVESEKELARCERELADAQATLRLLEAGTRPEEIRTEKARLARVQEELRYLETLHDKLRVPSPIGGVLITPRLRGKIGQYFKEGDLICEIEESGILEIDISLDEEEIAKVRPGYVVEFKARALPFEAFESTVERVAPVAANALAVSSAAAAAAGEAKAKNTVTVICRLNYPPADLRSGMTGYARVRCGDCSLGQFLFHRVMSFVRTEYWW